MNIVDFELAYFEAAVQHFDYYVKGTHPFKNDFQEKKKTKYYLWHGPVVTNIRQREC